MGTKFIVGLILLIASWACYSNSLHNGFVLDDHGYFNDSTMHSLKFVPYHFLLSKGKVFGIEKNSSKGYYRPMARAMYTVFYVAFEDNMVLYHAAHIFLLWSAGFLIYLILNAYFPQAGPAAFLAGLFFIVHPLNSTFINYISSSIYFLQTTLMLLSLWCVAREKYMYRWWAVLFFFMAVLCHECGMFLPIYAIILLLALRSPVWSRVWPLWAASGAYFIFSISRTSVLENLLQNSPVNSLHVTLGQYLSTFGKVSYWYLSRLVFPTDIVFLWGTPIALNIFWTVFLLFLFLGAIVLLAWSWKYKDKELFLGAGWIFASFIPGAFGGISRPGMICIEPHWVIFALIGFCICLGVLVARIKSRLYAWGLCLLIVFFWFCLDRQYNVLWSNEKTYCYYWHEVFPISQVPFYYLANVYQSENNFEEAKRLFDQTFKSPHYKESLDYNLTMGMIEVKQQHWEQARAHLENVLSMDPDNTTALTHLGIVAMMEKDNVKAEEYFKRANENKLEIIGRLDLAALYEGESNIQGARRLYQEILNIEPFNEIALVNLIQIYLQQGDKDNILKIARILADHSHNPIVLRNVGIIFQRYGKNP